LGDLVRAGRYRVAGVPAGFAGCGHLHERLGVPRFEISGCEQERAVEAFRGPARAGMDAAGEGGAEQLDPEGV
jgi:hypothetical protein